MRELEIARSMIRQRPDGDVERTLQKVIVALENCSPMDMAGIYALDFDNFELVIDILRGWRLQRHCGVARNGVAEGVPFIEKRCNV
jgi:hypothetical protein